MSRTVVVTGASGGVGASTLAAALAARLAREARSSVLVDLDLIGGGLDVTCGVEHVEGLRWPDLARVRGEVDPGRLVSSLPRVAGCALLAAGPSRRTPSAPEPGWSVVDDVVGSLTAGGVTVVVDLPRWQVPRWSRPVSPWLLVTGTRARDLADLDALVRAIERGTGPDSLAECLLVTAGPEPEAGLVAAVEEHLGLAHVGHVHRSPAVATAAERGEWPHHRVLRPVVAAVLEWAWRRGAA
jgi:NAD(P)-dependent dehydrogenase (short-subunit alcohol dehydrogenase family)